MKEQQGCDSEVCKHESKLGKRLPSRQDGQHQTPHLFRNDGGIPPGHNPRCKCGHSGIIRYANLPALLLRQKLTGNGKFSKAGGFATAAKT